MFNTKMRRTYLKNAPDPNDEALLLLLPRLPLPFSPPPLPPFPPMLGPLQVADMIGVVDVEKKEHDVEDSVPRAIACKTRSPQT